MRRTSRALVTYLLVFAFLLGQVPASFANKPGPPVGKVIQAEPEPVATVSVGPAVTRTASKDPVTETLAFSKSWSKASNVVIVQSGDWRSAMQASALAGALKAPVIATSSKGLSKSTVSRLKSMKVKTAYLIGTKKALPTGITKKLTSMRIKSTRLTGKNVYDQGRTVARKVKSITKTTPIAIVVNETDYADVAAVSAYSAAARVPVLLVKNGSIPADTTRTLASLGTTETLVVGDENQIPDWVMEQFPSPTRIAGADQYETSVLLADFAVRHGMSLFQSVLTSGDSFPNAVLAGTWAARKNAPILLTPPDALAPKVEEFLRNNSASFKVIRVFGTTRRVSAQTAQAAVDAATTWYYEDVLYVDNADSALRTSQVTSDTVVLTGPAQNRLAVGPGTVLVGAPSEISETGYLRKVVSASTAGDTRVCATVAASLMDVIAQGGMMVSGVTGTTSALAASGLSAASSAAGITATPKGFKASISLDVSYPRDDPSDDNRKRVTGGLKAEGTFELAQVTTFTWNKRHWYSLVPEYVELKTTFTNSLSLGVSGYVKGTYTTPARKLGRMRLTAIPTPIPGLIIVPTSEVEFSVEIAGRFGLKTGFEWSRTYEFGFQWRPGDGTRLIKNAFGPGSRMPTLDVYAEGSVTPKLDVEMQFMMSDVAGPTFGVTPSVELKAEWTSEDLGNIKFTGTLNIEATIGGELSLFGLLDLEFEWAFSVSPPVPLFERDLTVVAFPGTAPPPPEETQQPGSISGTVTNAMTGSSLPDAQVSLRRGRNNPNGSIVKMVDADAYGEYGFSGVMPGDYTVTAFANGYFADGTSVTVGAGQELGGVNVALVPLSATDDYRIILSWGATPSDLDSHVTGPDGTGGRFHVYYANGTFTDGEGSLVANLDHDDTSSWGPETITVIKPGMGMYRYSVHDFSNRWATSSSVMSESQAVVRVYKGPRLMGVYDVPRNPGTLWRVFEIVDGVFVPINTMSYVTDPGMVQ